MADKLKVLDNKRKDKMMAELIDVKFLEKIKSLNKGDVIEYYAGRPVGGARALASKKFAAVMRAYEMGLCSPVQKRLTKSPTPHGVGTFSYLAQRN